MSKQAKTPAAPTISEGNVVTFTPVQLTEEQARAFQSYQEQELFVAAGRKSGQSDISGKVSASEAAGYVIKLCEREGYAQDWTDIDARTLPPVLRRWHIALIEGLKVDKHPAPNMVWKRIREEGMAHYKTAATPAGGGDGGGGEVESAREKIRRLTEENIQSMYTRIVKATDIDREVLNLLPDLRDMAKALGMKLREPDQK